MEFEFLHAPRRGFSFCFSSYLGAFTSTATLIPSYLLMMRRVLMCRLISPRQNEKKGLRACLFDALNPAPCLTRTSCRPAGPGTYRPFVERSSTTLAPTSGSPHLCGNSPCYQRGDGAWLLYKFSPLHKNLALCLLNNCLLFQLQQLINI